MSKKLKLQPYKVPDIQAISPIAQKKRKAVGEWFISKCDDCPKFTHNIWWPDEAHFYVHGDRCGKNLMI